MVLSAERDPNTEANSTQPLSPSYIKTSRGKEELSSRRTRKEKGEGTLMRTGGPAGGVVSRSGSEHICLQHATSLSLLHQNQSRERGAVLTPRVVLSADRAQSTYANSAQHLPPSCSETGRGKEELS